MVIVPLARLVQRFIRIVEQHRLQPGGAAIMGRIRRRYNAGFRIKRAVEAMQRPAVGEIAKINAVSGVMIPTENCFVCKLDLGIGACRLRGIDRLHMHPILG